MGITLKQLYEQTKEQFGMQLLAGMDAMDNEVSRLYYLEDILTSNGTRHGELLLTTAMQVKREEDWLQHFVESVLPYHPSGIMINIGGYLDEIPQNIIEYCDKQKLPLLIFPWETVLQDIMQDFTNRIFETEQKERTISKAFSNAIFTPEDRGEYRQCLEKNGYGQCERYIAAVVELPAHNEERTYFVKMVQSNWSKIVVVEHKQELILVLYDLDMEAAKKVLKEALSGWEKRFPQKEVWIGVGIKAEDYSQIGDSYEKAGICRKYAKKSGERMVFFEDLGVIGLLVSSDKKLLEKYMEGKLGKLEQHDRKNQTDYMGTLKSFLYHGGNAVDVAKELYIHRNTVNYRIKKIKEILGEDFSKMDSIVEYRIAYYIKMIL